MASPKASSKEIAPALRESLLLKACRREPTPRAPIWLMRQAGRYMKEYRELRSRIGFLDLCKDSDLCAKITVDAVDRLGVDAAIIFSDLLLILEPMGFDVSYGKDQGPVIGNPFVGPDSLGRMKPVDVPTSLRFVLEAISKTRKSLKSEIPLIGFAGAPFTMATYLIEGGGSKDFLKTKRLMKENSAIWHALLEKLVDATIEYLNLQIDAGVQAVQIFDSWAGLLTADEYREYVLPYLRRLISNMTAGVPVISFGTRTSHLLPLLKEAGGNVIGVDWRIDLDKAWETIGYDVALMGNLDPAALLTTPDEIEVEVKRILAQVRGRPGYIFNLGHGVLPGTPLENVLSLVECVKKLSRTS